MLVHVGYYEYLIVITNCVADDRMHVFIGHVVNKLIFWPVLYYLEPVLFKLNLSCTTLSLTVILVHAVATCF